MALSRKFMLSLRWKVSNLVFNEPWYSTVEKLGLQKRRVRRGTKAGKRKFKWRLSSSMQSSFVSPIPTRITERPTHPLSCKCASNQSTASLTVPHPQLPDCKAKTWTAKIATWNANSMTMKTPLITDMIVEYKFDVLAITESWLRGDDRDNEVLADLSCYLPNFSVLHCPRSSSRGGGIGLLIKSGFKVKENEAQRFVSFELMDTTISSGSTFLRIITIYRPPPSSRNKLTPRMFFSEFSVLLESIAIFRGELLILGDFNFHVDIPNDREASCFMDLLDSAGFQQHVHVATHRAGHTLDLVISRRSSHTLKDIAVFTGSPSDHHIVKCDVNISSPLPVKTTIRSRKLCDIRVENFVRDIQASTLFNSPVVDLSHSIEQYENVLCDLIDIHAPVKERSVVLRPSYPWYCDELRKAKRMKRRSERKWLQSGLEIDRFIVISQKPIIA
ncbi:hypothetical protein HOLleu_21042 [Holothuria leucospilota]|uniref:Endonuclease/exonuclease/phosphatase domain-containing protein n=1 Tax=Holothuria leucospilota TaxID=206669 RepID=A0A9Q1H6J5_HOLLE|nr:hypothetical protein HOLleu_21042 [Holothuria leucospilota]